MTTFHKINRQRRGISLVEVVISTLVVGGMLVTALNTLGAVYRSQSINSTRMIGPGLAQELMSEVLAMPYQDPEGVGAGNSVEVGEVTTARAGFDDIDDYHNWKSANACAKDGTVHTGFSGWQRKVNVYWADPLSGSNWPSETGLKKIHVTVSDPAGNVYELYALRWKEGMLEQTPEKDTTVVAWIGAQLHLGKSTQPACMGTNICNQATITN